MIADRHFVDSRIALFDLIEKETRESRGIAVHAGHFLLIFDDQEQRLIPCVVSELRSGRHEQIRRELAQFPFLSWRLACELIGALARPDCHILTIVNDWQYVPSGADRQEFYARYSQLPATYVTAAEAIGPNRPGFLAPKPSKEFPEQQPFFSERALRNRYNRRLKKMARKGQLPAEVEIQLTDTGQACHLLEVLGSSREVYCPGTDADCSKEVAQLIDEVVEIAACDTFINFYPAVCKEYVELGSELPSRLFGTPVSRVINIALPAIGVMTEEDLFDGAEVSVHLL